MLLGVVKALARSALQATLGDWVDELSVTDMLRKEVEVLDEVRFPRIVADAGAVVPDISQVSQDALAFLSRQKCPFRT